MLHAQDISTQSLRTADWNIRWQSCDNNGSNAINSEKCLETVRLIIFVHENTYVHRTTYIAKVVDPTNYIRTNNHKMSRTLRCPSWLGWWVEDLLCTCTCKPSVSDWERALLLCVDWSEFSQLSCLTSPGGRILKPTTPTVVGWNPIQGNSLGIWILYIVFCCIVFLGVSEQHVAYMYIYNLHTQMHIYIYTCFMFLCCSIHAQTLYSSHST